MNITLIVALILVSYFAYNCWQDAKLAIAKMDKIIADYKQYIKDIQEIKKWNQILLRR
ncbi:hypothetical protein [Candidatus Schmidhempelia bombi]|uniref:hypothetical protein n=1 Tax=Candidatus Schmidhempelia bombi TaxID=1505866 RepID=UPI001EE8480C|nr:hypothetical protein [Candidatus Schmidhempelia bombi]